MSTPEENQNGTPREFDPAEAPTPSQALPGFPPPEQAPGAYPPQGSPSAYPPQPTSEQASVAGQPAGYPPPAYAPPASGQQGYAQAPGVYPPPFESAPPVSQSQFGQPVQLAPAVSQPLAKFTLIQYGVLALGSLINTWVGVAAGDNPAFANLERGLVIGTLIFGSLFTIVFAAGSAALIYFPVRRGRAWGRTVGTIFASISGAIGVIQLIGSLIGLAAAPATALLGIVLALAAVAVSAYWLVLAWRKPRV